MAAEKAAKDASGQKQKVMIAIVVIVVLVIIWQVMGLKGGGSNSTPPSIASTPGAGGAMKPQGTAANTAMSGAPTMSASITAPAMTSDINQPRSMPVQGNTEILKLQQQTQADYIASINKLQMLKIQREIDETKTAIANAELNRMTAEKSIADLITSKENSSGMDNSMTPPPLPVATNQATAMPVMPPQPVQQQPQLINFTALSVTFQNNKWTAILASNGKNISVAVGDVLEDGSVVTAINRNSVVLKRENKVRTLTIASSY